MDDVHTNVIPAEEVRATTGVRGTAAAPSLVGVAGTTIRGTIFMRMNALILVTDALWAKLRGS